MAKHGCHKYTDLPIVTMARGALQELVSILASLRDAVQTPICLESSVGDYKLRLVITHKDVNLFNANGAIVPVLKEAEKDILSLFTDITVKLLTAEVLDLLDKAGKIHGTSTILRGLSRLVHAGLLRNDRKRMGFYLPVPTIQVPFPVIQVVASSSEIPQT